MCYIAGIHTRGLTQAFLYLLFLLEIVFLFSQEETETGSLSNLPKVRGRTLFLCFSGLKALQHSCLPSRGLLLPHREFLPLSGTKG